MEEELEEKKVERGRKGSSRKKRERVVERGEVKIKRSGRKRGADRM